MGTCPCEKGDKIDLTYIINDKWNNVKQVYKNTHPETETPEIKNVNLKNNSQKSICLSYAKDLVIGGLITLDEIETYTNKFLKFLE